MSTIKKITLPAHRRRGLLAEGAALFAHAGVAPNGKALRLYVRALEFEDPEVFPIIADCFLRRPFLLRFVEPLGRENRMRRRMDIAMRISEASGIAGASIFFDYEGAGRLHVLVRLAGNALAETFFLPFRVVCAWRLHER